MMTMSTNIKNFKTDEELNNFLKETKNYFNSVITLYEKHYNKYKEAVTEKFFSSMEEQEDKFYYYYNNVSEIIKILEDEEEKEKLFDKALKIKEDNEKIESLLSTYKYINEIGNFDYNVGDTEYLFFDDCILKEEITYIFSKYDKKTEISIINYNVINNSATKKINKIIKNKNLKNPIFIKNMDDIVEKINSDGENFFEANKINLSDLFFDFSFICDEDCNILDLKSNKIQKKLLKV